jgi:hypothetical protein
MITSDGFTTRTPLKQRVLDRESDDVHVAEARVIEAINEDAMRDAVDDCRVGTSPQE